MSSPVDVVELAHRVLDDGSCCDHANVLARAVIAMAEERIALDRVALAAANVAEDRVTRRQEDRMKLDDALDALDRLRRSAEGRG